MAGVVEGLASGLEVGAGAPVGKGLPRGTESPGLWCAEDGGLRKRWGTGVRDPPRPFSLGTVSCFPALLSHARVWVERLENQQLRV